MSTDALERENLEAAATPHTRAASTFSSGAGNAPRVAYIMSRFPKLTETFVLFEMLALERCGARVEVFPLLRARNTSAHPEAAGMWRKVCELLRRPAGEAVMHPEAQPFVARAHYVPFINLAILAAQFHFLLRRPAAYLGALWTLFRANLGSANFLVGGLAIFPKTVYFARRMQQLDITHIHAHFANHPAAAAYVVHRLTGIPYSFTAHGADLQVDQHMLREKVAAARWVVSISHDNTKLIRSVCGDACSDRIKVVRCGVDTTIFRQPERPVAAIDRPLQVVCTGTLYEVKGQAYLIDAMRLLRQRGVSAECHLVGDGPLREALERQVQEVGLGDCVHFLGRQTRKQISDLLRSSDVLVAPSVPTAEGRREGIPVVLMEAMASGLPVVASRLSGIPELVDDEHTGLLISPKSAEAIADALTRLAAEPDLRSKLGGEGRKRVLADFDVQMNAQRLFGLFFTEC